MRLLWGTLIIPDFCWREPIRGLQMLPSATRVTDCKSLCDLVSRTASPSCEEFRATLEVLLICERCQEHCVFRWIPASLQVADALTKPLDPVLLRHAFPSGKFQLYDETESPEKHAHKKHGLRCMAQTDVTSKTNVTSKEVLGSAICRWLVHSCVALMWLHVNPCTTNIFLWPIWHKCQWRVGRGFLVLDTKPLPWAISLGGKHLVAAGSIWREDTDLSSHSGGGTTFISCNQGLLILGLPVGRGAIPFTKLYIYSCYN